MAQARFPRHENVSSTREDPFVALRIVRWSSLLAGSASA